MCCYIFNAFLFVLAAECIYLTPEASALSPLRHALRLSSTASNSSAFFARSRAKYFRSTPFALYSAEPAAVAEHSSQQTVSPKQQVAVTEVDTKSEDRIEVRQNTLLAGLAILSGFADVICYHRYACFVNMMTGNTIHAVLQLSEGLFRESLSRGMLVLGYCLGSALSTKCSVRVGKAAPPLLFLLSDVFNQFDFHLLLIAIAFGWINVMTAKDVGVTNAATGHLSKFSVGLTSVFNHGENTSAQKLFRQSRRFLFFFVSSLLIGGLFVRFVVPPSQIPLGLILGLSYFFLLKLYS